MRVEVARGERDVESVLACGRCRGKGEVETAFGSGAWGQCERCHGAKLDPTPNLYAYDVDGPVEVGDHVVIPASWVPGSTPSIATVVRLGSTYRGSVVRARRVEPR